MSSKTDYNFDSKAQRLLIKPSMVGNYPGSVLIQSKADDSFKSLPFLITVEKEKNDPDQNGKDPGKKDDDKKKDPGETDQDEDEDRDESKKKEIKIEDILTETEIEETKTVTQTEISDFLTVRH